MPETILSESHPDRRGVVRGWLLWLAAWALAFAAPVDGRTSESVDGDWRTWVELAGYDEMGCPYYRVRQESGELSRLHFYLGMGDYYVVTRRR
ncbi:hypothetical protein [Spectribacter hydrogenoxidans]|uniref:Secreted protein n=1 Tax=Spectribacter hydrogenoxidans TaxID=3075608 RepID=A0ABU3C027_9GAMM|nr:hypothetical protein [Salinisphaera sp. W335]MDT0634899.1 hypothetical protein [Salinisphaera sp. W335]